MRRIWLSLALLLLLRPAGAAGQRLVIEARSRQPAVRALQEIVARDDYRVIDRDTVFPTTFRHEGDLVVVGAVVRLEGAVTGSVGVVGGSFFLRPGARVGGVAAAVAGSIGMSSLATIGDTLSLPLEYDVTVTRAGEEFRVAVRNPARPPMLALAGAFGVLLPSYDRVNGATVRVGVGGSFGADSLRPRYQVVGSYYSARGTVGARGRFLLPFGGGAHLSVAGGREVVTRDAWIRDDFSNSVSALIVRSDVRNYYESDYGAVFIRQLPPVVLDPGQGYFVPRLGVIASRDRSLAARDPWTLFGDEPWRPNPEVFEGTLTSAVAGFTTGGRGRTSDFQLDADVEWAFPSPIGFDWGEQEFVQAIVDGRWSMLAMWGHTLAVRAHAMQTFGPDPAPPQRWSHVGGPGTLPTLPQASLRGDNLVFVESTYAVPLRFLTLPVVGIPSLAARHAVGSAWVTNTDAPRWEQNLGLGVRFNVAEFFLYADPARADHDPHFSFGVRMPF